MIWSDTDMRHIAETTAQSVILADANMSHRENHCTECDMGCNDMSHIVKTTAQSVILTDTNMSHSENHCTECDMG